MPQVRYKYIIKTPNKIHEFKRLKDARQFAQWACVGTTIISRVPL
jgi:hypothetical protein